MVWRQTQAITSTNEYQPCTHMMTSSNGNILRVYWPFVRGIHRWPVNSLHKGQWRGALMRSFICAWIYGWVNNREAGDLRRHPAHYDVTVMKGINVSPSLSVWILPFRIDTVSIFREEISNNEAGMVVCAEAEETVFVQRFSLLPFVCKKVDVKIFKSHGVCNGNWLRCNLCSQKSLKTNSMSPNALSL